MTPNRDKTIGAKHSPLHLSMLEPNPFKQFARWFDDAKAAGEFDPTAMTLATVDKKYHVTARMVLLKHFDESGFVFFSNYRSAKAKAMEEIDRVALVFWWPLCARQVRITGQVADLASEKSDAYFQTRTRESQLAAIASPQSQPIANRDLLIEKQRQVKQQYQNSEPIPRPNYWGGYIVTPDSFEFWQDQPYRLHDRFVYQLTESWKIQQLAP